MLSVFKSAAGNLPLMIMHGSSGCRPIGLETYPNLSTHFQVFAINVLAQPNKSAETRLSMKDDSFSKWINEVIDKLKINNVTLIVLFLWKADYFKNALT